MTKVLWLVGLGSRSGADHHQFLSFPLMCLGKEDLRKDRHALAEFLLPFCSFANQKVFRRSLAQTLLEELSKLRVGSVARESRLLLKIQQLAFYTWKLASIRVYFHSKWTQRGMKGVKDHLINFLRQLTTLDGWWKKAFTRPTFRQCLEAGKNLFSPILEATGKKRAKAFPS